jgi:Zn-dependent protease with chaperone function
MRPSLGLRVFVSVALLLGFYVFAIGISAGLLFLPYAQYRVTGRVHGYLAFLCIAGAGLILWSLLPRREKFVPPGPLVDAGTQPRLFAELDRVAAAVGQPMPPEVYVDFQVNAAVSLRGGWLGFGGRRIMILGLPLLQVLTVSQFRAILAHEFGHFHGGDTRLGPWLYQTQAALGRTLAALQQSVLRFLFIGYAKLFLRVTNAISRRQEHAADRLAAATMGPGPLTDGLRATMQAATVFESYFFHEAVPALEAGFRPPLTEGFARFLRARPVSEALPEILQAALTERRADPYDTHPPLRDRIAALADVPAVPAPRPDPPALTLLDDLPALESGILRCLNPEADVAAMAPIRWEDVAARVHVPRWRAFCAERAAELRPLTPETVPTGAALAELGWTLAEPGLPQEEVLRGAKALLGAAVALLLVEDGWSIEAEPGAAVRMSRDGRACAPFEEVADRCDGRIADPEWRARCAELGIAARPLAK